MKRPFALALALALALVFAVILHSRAPTEPARSARPTPSRAEAAPDDAPTPRPLMSPVNPRDAAVIARAASNGDSVVSGAWGSAAGQFGRQAATESNPEGPMALAVGSDGSVYVVDQVNRRVQRFARGALVGTIALPTATAQDLCVTPDGAVLTLDRLVAREVRVTLPSGETRAVPIVGGPITEGGAVSGVFSDAEGVWVEREHQEVVRIADPSGSSDPARPTRYGRPTRDGAHFMRAAISDRMGGVVTVSVASRENGAMDWSTPVSLGASVLSVVLLDSDLAGRVYLGASVARVQPGATPRFTQERVVVARLDDTGTVTGTLELPPISGEDEVFRPLSVDDAGAVYMMVSSARGMAVRRWIFPE